jgi:hypothetical protein
MDSDLMQELRHRAVDERKSLSAWITDRLRGLVSQDEAAEAARKDGLSLLSKGVHLGGRDCVREKLYDR